MPSGWGALTSIFCCSRERTVSRSDRITASANRVSPPAAEARLTLDSAKPSNSFTRKFILVMVDEVYVMWVYSAISDKTTETQRTQRFVSVSLWFYQFR